MWGKEQLRVMVHDFTRPLEKNSVAGYATYSRSLKDADRIKLRTLFLEVLWEEYKSAKDAMDRAPIGVKYEAISAMVDYSLVNTQVAEKNSNLLNALVNQAEEGEGDVNFNEILADLIVLPSKNLKLKDTNRDKVLGIADRLRKKFQESRKQYKQSNLSPYTEDSTTNNEQNDFTLVSTTQEDEQDVNINNQPEKPTKKQRAVLRRQVEAQQRQAEKALKLLQKEAEIKLEKEIPRIEAVHTPTETTVTSPTNHNGVVNTKPKATASTPSSSKLLNTLAKQSNLKFSDTITRLLDLIEDAYEAAKANYFLAIQLPLKDHSVDQVYELFQALVEISVENKNQIGNLAPYLSGVVVCHAARMPSSTRNTPLIELILTLTENDLNDKNKWPEIFARFYKEASLTTFIHSRTESERYIHISYVIWFITAASSGIMPPTLNIKETTLILLKGSEILDFINLFDEYALMIQTQELQDSMSEKNVLVKVLNSKSIDYIQSNDNRGALHQALRAVLPSQAEVHKVLYGARKYYKLQEQHQSMPIDEVGYRLSVLVDFEYTVVNQLEPIIKILLSKMPLCKILFDDNARNELFKNTLCPVLGVLMPYRHGLAVQELFMHPDNLADFELLITCAIAFINQYTALSSFHLIQVAPGGEIGQMLEHRIDLFQAINSFKKYCEGDLFQNQLSEQISNSNSTSKTQTVIQDPEYYKVLKITKNFEQDRPLWTSKETIKDKWLASQITQFENDFPTGKERGDAVNHFKKLINSGAFVFPDGARACALKFADMMASSASKVNASSEASSSSTTSPTNHLRDAKKEKSQGVNNNNNNNNNNSNNTHIKKKKQ